RLGGCGSCPLRGPFALHLKGRLAVFDLDFKLKCAFIRYIERELLSPALKLELPTSTQCLGNLPQSCRCLLTRETLLLLELQLRHRLPPFFPYWKTADSLPIRSPFQTPRIRISTQA